MINFWAVTNYGITAEVVFQFPGAKLHRNGQWNIFSNDMQYKISSEGDYTICVDGFAEMTDSLKQMNGEYSIAKTQNDTVVWCTDWCGTRPIYFCTSGDKITVSNDYNFVVAICGNCYKSKANRKYIFHKDKLSYDTNVTFDFHKDSQYGDLEKSFESAVSKRINDKTTLAVSGGIDSGALLATVKKQNLKVNLVARLDEYDDHNIIKQRVAGWPAQMISPSENKLEEVRSHDLFKFISDLDLRHTICLYQHMNKGDRMIIGYGSDEFFEAQQFKIGNPTEAPLSLLWPWHNQGGRFDYDVYRYDVVSNFFNIETVYPFFDIHLIQTWINTLKQNKKWSRNWLIDYLQRENIAFSEVNSV